MDNLTTFFMSENGFLSYLVTYIVFIAAILIAFSIGFALRKNKNKKLEVAGASAAEDTEDKD
ncbi:MAG: hypothetical protein K6C99_06690 [Lachnospiraceae bacterium]|nr:hypothetical protein [Lachnospiraceae bacterium]